MGRLDGWTAPMGEGLLAGKVVLVSGAGDGLGRAICVAMAAGGARVVAGDIDGDVLAATLDAVRAAGGTATGLVTDIRDAAACTALVEHAVATFGALDVVVNDAYHGGDNRPFEAADLADWREVAEVNVWGTLTMTQAALPYLKASGRGRVVMVATHGVELIQPSFGAYTASKAALAHLTKLLAAELGGYGIRVNAVYPGPILGPALQAYLAALAASTGRPVEEVHAEWGGKNPLGYLVPPEEIAGSVVFLASDLALPVTGQALYVNAGEVFH
jgi:NAD(P)-dependent dehydrogenase (short-subunit alcohol dehydrogenase family)